MDTTNQRVRATVEASAWRSHLTETGAETSVEFERWLAAEPEHRAAWQRVQAPWEFITQQAHSPEALEWRRIALSDARAASRQRWIGAGRRAWIRYGLAAGFALVVASALTLWVVTRPDAYTTGVGERRVVMLDDGSRLMLDAQTEVRVSYAEARRELKLIRGQVRFDVAPDVQRPFTVHAHGQKVIALGTAFNVDRLGASTRVTLIEGRVAVVNAVEQKGRELKTGEQLTAEDDGSVTVNAVSLELVTAWQNGQLAFNNEPLAVVVERMNRYAGHRLQVGDSRAGALSVSGVFSADDIDGFVSTVTHYLPLRAERGREGRVVLKFR